MRVLGISEPSDNGPGDVARVPAVHGRNGIIEPDLFGWVCDVVLAYAETRETSPIREGHENECQPAGANHIHRTARVRE